MDATALPLERPPYLTGYAVKGYKAFGVEASIELGRLTIILGRNNAGKTALCNAPLFFTHPFELGALTPFPLKKQGIDFCSSLLAACFARQPSGFTGMISLSGGESTRVTIGGAALSEKNQRQVVTQIAVEHPQKPLRRRGVLEWPEVQKLLGGYPELSRIPGTIGALIGLRPAIERSYEHLGGVPRGIGPAGEHAVQYLALARSEGQSRIFEEVNAWFVALGVKIDVELHRDAFEVTAARPGGPPVNIVDTGSGIAQVLPLVVALTVVPPEDLPRLFIVEQPELDLHPYAHAHVAELLLSAVARDRNLRLLVETHSDALVLRLRREVAAQRLAPEDVRIYFVEEGSEIPGGSEVREIRLNDRGTPAWWPRGVFAENQAEFHRIRQELAKRDGKV
jgi:hypothetical protein